jgi:hypothetical protein
MTMTLQALPHNGFESLDPEALEIGIGALIPAYQAARSRSLAWFVVHYAQALCRHPEFAGSDEDRCAWQRLAGQWRWLASLPEAVPGAVARAVV